MQVFLCRAGPGWVAGAWSEAGLRALVLPRECRQAALDQLACELQPFPLPRPGRAEDPPPVLMEEIERYFRGEKVSFSIPVDWTGYTPFQRRVLEITRAIPYGEVSSYGRIAALAGSPKSARAVGGVMRANRTPLIVPCHRVIASSGSLGGFTGGLAMKKYLLSLENAAAILDESANLALIKQIGDYVL